MPLEGRAGKDHLTGGSDADWFKFDSASESLAGSGRDVILDMAGIDLSALDPSALGGDQALVWLGQSADAGPLASGSVRALDLGSTVIVQANTDADLAIDLAIELRSFVTTLVSSTWRWSQDMVKAASPGMRASAMQAWCHARRGLRKRPARHGGPGRPRHRLDPVPAASEAARSPLPRLVNTVIRTIRYLLALGIPAAGAVPDPGIVYCP
jgi:hypothetical protein